MLDKYQAIVITGYTGIMMVDMSSFHKDVESRFGHTSLEIQFLWKRCEICIKKSSLPCVTRRVNNDYTNSSTKCIESGKH